MKLALDKMEDVQGVTYVQTPSEQTVPRAQPIPYIPERFGKSISY